MKISKVLGGILLVSGTTIGAAMLALPVSTGASGFLPSLLLFICYWIFMTYTAFLILEVGLWMERDANMITMARKTIGRFGQMISWATYLFLLYALTTAYIAGSSPIFLDALNHFTGADFPSWVGPIPLLFLFGSFVYKGTFAVDYINRVLMLGLVVSYFLLIFFLYPHINPSYLTHVNFDYLLIALSVASTSFGFHIIIPSLIRYLDRDVKSLKKVIFIGSMIPLFVYVIWELITLGVIPVQGAGGIYEAYQTGTNGAILLTGVVNTWTIAYVARFFSFFAIVTSFLGVSLSLRDFLADGLRIKKTGSGKMILILLTFLPPLIFTLTDPRAFLSALEYAGAFGVVILLGFLPALMVFWGRYIRKEEGFAKRAKFYTPGGKPALIAVMIISTLVIIIEILRQWNMVPTP